MTACEKCGQEHITRHGGPACTGHRSGYTDETTGERVMYPKDQQPPCKRPPLNGQDVCQSHGGWAGQNKAAGEQRMAENNAKALAQRWGLPVDVRPTEAVLEQVRIWAGLELFYRQQVENLEPEEMIWGRTKLTEGFAVVGTGPDATLEAADTAVSEAKPHIWITLHEQASTNVVKFASEAIKAGIEERRVRLAEQQGALVADVIRGILDDLQLTPEQLGRVGTVVPARLRLLTNTA